MVRSGGIMVLTNSDGLGIVMNGHNMLWWIIVINEFGLERVRTISPNGLLSTPSQIQLDRRIGMIQLSLGIKFAVGSSSTDQTIPYSFLTSLHWHDLQILYLCQYFCDLQLQSLSKCLVVWMHGLSWFVWRWDLTIPTDHHFPSSTSDSW